MVDVNHVQQSKCKVILIINNKVRIVFCYLFRLINFYFLALQFDSMEKKKIQIKCHPRSRFRPRTQNESKTASHYIRCEDNSPHDYPTVFVC
jgi:hypothetical protein